jgi:hypothetical protein
MRTPLTLAFILLFSFGQAQSAGDDYVFTSDCTLQQYDPFTNTVIPATGQINLARRGYVFTIHSRVTVGGILGYSIRFWRFKGAGTPDVVVAGVTHHFIGSTDNNLYFFISEATLVTSTTNEFRKRHGVIKLDAVVLPIKLRFKNKQPGGEFDFLQSISVGPALSFNTNYGGPFGNTSTSILLGFNVTNVSVDEKTAPGAVDSKTTMLGLSPFLGFNVDYRGINISIMSGLDILTGKAGQVYSYRKSPWLGISVGGSLFSVGGKEKNEP